LLASCGHFGSSADRKAPPNPAILLSVSSRAVYLVNPTEGTQRVLAGRLSDFQGGYAAWAPDHARLAYGDDGIVLLDPRTNRSEELIGGRSVSMPAWSPDGLTMVYGDGISLWTTGMTRVRPRRFRIPAILAPLEMAWSQTGVIALEGLQLDCAKLIRCTSTGSSEIWTILPDGTGLTQVTRVGHAEKPKWSPRGLELLFVRTYSDSKKPSELWLTQADGSSAHRMLGQGVVAADWSPDGSKLVVVRHGPRPRTLQLYTGRSDGTGLKPVGKPVAGTDATIDW